LPLHPKKKTKPKATITGKNPNALPTKPRQAAPAPKPHRSGFVALIGRPNVGKSTLLNHLVGQKVAITSPVMQTTRHRIRGVITRPNAQLVVLDCPGFSKPVDTLGGYLVQEGSAALDEADVLALVMDITEPPGGGDLWLIEQVKRQNKPFILILNKADRLAQNPQLIKERQAAYQAPILGVVVAGKVQKVPQGSPFKGTLVVSAKTGKHLLPLQERLFELLPQGPAYYEADALTDQRMREMCAELIREQVLLQTQDELPHSVAVGIELFDETQEPVRIEATLYVNQNSQKGMVIGKDGERIKAIGTKARKPIEALLGVPVFLGLRVKLKQNWRKDTPFLKSLGLAPPAQ
jgi:GTP-binding protein Era